MKRTPISASEVLNEAYHYQKPSCFSRGLMVEIGDTSMLHISGTASIDENGNSIHIDNFKRQAKRAFKNVKALLEAEGARWCDVVKTTIYIKDIEKNYDVFNQVRLDFFRVEGIEFYPASVCVEAKLCRPELLIEMDALALIRTAELHTNHRSK